MPWHHALTAPVNARLSACLQSAAAALLQCVFCRVKSSDRPAGSGSTPGSMQTYGPSRLNSLSKQRAAKQAYNPAVTNSSRLSICFRIRRVCRLTAPRCICSQAIATHTVVRARPCFSRYSQHASRKALLPSRSVRSLALCAGLQHRHGGADQVQYVVVTIVIVTGFETLLFPAGCGCDLRRHGACSDSQSHLLCLGSTLRSKLQLPCNTVGCSFAATHCCYVLAA